MKAINDMVFRISEQHGCQVIVNGLLGTIKYYLRLVNNPSEFMNLYSSAVLRDKVIKTSHKRLLKKLLMENF